MRLVIKPVGIASVIGAVAILTYLTLNSAPNASGEVLAGASDPILTTRDGKLTKAFDQDRTKGQTQIVYDNALKQGWQINGWAKELKTDDSTTDADGSGASISAAFRLPGKYEGIRFDHDPFDSAPYDRISMKINGGSKGGQKLKITGLLRSKERRSVTLDPLPANKWKTVTVRLADLGIASKFTMTGFTVQSASPDAEEPIHVDDVRLLTPKDGE